MHPVRHDSPRPNSLTNTEINMNTKASSLTTKPLICFAAVAACAVLFSAVEAAGNEVTVKVPVSTVGLDPTQPAGARKLYVRLQRAADIACTHGNRVDLQPPTSLHDCYEKALGDAVRSARQPQLNIVYLATHTARDAAKYGIVSPALMAAK